MSTMRVAQVTRPDGPFEIVERLIARVGEACDRTMSGKARFRVVLRM